jgi:Rifampin ADP-ribosyl transferase
LDLLQRDRVRCYLGSGTRKGRRSGLEPTGPFMDDPNVTDRKLPGNPTKSYRSREPLRVVGEHLDWRGHSPGRDPGDEELYRG